MIAPDIVKRTTRHRAHTVPSACRYAEVVAALSVHVTRHPNAEIRIRSEKVVAYDVDLASRSLKRSPKLIALITLAVGFGMPSHAHALGVQNTQPSAYECAAGPKVWIQMDPCPRIYLKDIREDSDDYAMNQEPERGSSVLLERVPVQQQPLDAAELCQKLDDHKVLVKHDGSSDVYERNVVKAKFCP
jgi:hypothetical protein